MPKGVFNIPTPVNEPVKSYVPGSPEREELIAMINELKGIEMDVPMHIGGQEVKSEKKVTEKKTSTSGWNKKQEDTSKQTNNTKDTAHKPKETDKRKIKK